MATQLRVSRIIYRGYSVNETLSIALTVFLANSQSNKGEKCSGRIGQLTQNHLSAKSTTDYIV